MILENISLTNFKNYNELQTGFSKEINCIVGNNGSGKTNLLDAIYALALTKSAFNAQDQQLILHGATFFAIKGLFQKSDKKYEVICNLMHGQKKRMICNKKAYDTMSEHIGEFPVVMIAPGDADVISGTSEIRRKFIDGMIAQIDKIYLQDILTYQRALLQRNNLLKQFAERRSFDMDILAPYDQIIIDCGLRIRNKRADFITDFLPVFENYYLEVTDGAEQAMLHYESEFAGENAAERFRKNVQNDRQAQRTTMGIHRDDYVFSVGGHALKKFGSQGQQKSFLISLKMAQFDLLKTTKNFKPILLLDDIFDKLDDIRIGKLLSMISAGAFGQIFISDARPERTRKLLSDVRADIRMFRIDKGVLGEITL
ncbi:MAG: DNA replication/repair protein RecF [Cyclobacteriaceae bacterium]